MAQNRTVAAGAALGTTPPSITMTGDDNALTLTFGSGTSPATGTVATVTCPTSYASATGDVQLVPVVRSLNDATRLLGLTAAWVDATRRQYTIACGTAPTASQGATTYSALVELITAP